MTENLCEQDIEVMYCGGCELPTLFEDAKEVGSHDDYSIDEPHCPRCGTREEYEETVVKTYSLDE